MSIIWRFWKKMCQNDRVEGANMVASAGRRSGGGGSFGGEKTKNTVFEIFRLLLQLEGSFLRTKRACRRSATFEPHLPGGRNFEKSQRPHLRRLKLEIWAAGGAGVGPHSAPAAGGFFRPVGSQRAQICHDRTGGRRGFGEVAMERAAPDASVLPEIDFLTRSGAARRSCGKGNFKGPCDSGDWQVRRDRLGRHRKPTTICGKMVRVRSRYLFSFFFNRKNGGGSEKKGTSASGRTPPGVFEIARCATRRSAARGVALGFFVFLFGNFSKGPRQRRPR